MVELQGEERQINGVNGNYEEQKDLEEFDQEEDDLQGESFFSQNPFTKVLEESIRGRKEVQLN